MSVPRIYPEQCKYVTASCNLARAVPGELGPYIAQKQAIELNMWEGEVKCMQDVRSDVGDMRDASKIATTDAIHISATYKKRGFSSVYPLT